MAVDLQALKAAAAGGKAGLATYRDQQTAVEAARDAAINLLSTRGYSSRPDTVGISAALGETAGRGLRGLAAYGTAAGQRQTMLDKVPDYLGAQDERLASIPTYQQGLAEGDLRQRLVRSDAAAQAGRAFQQEEARKKFEYDQKQWNRKFRVKQGLPADG